MSDLRRERLQQLIDSRFDGVQSAAARALGLSTSQISDLLKGRGSFGERLARRIEQSAGLASGWLDKARGPATSVETIEVMVDGHVALTLPAGSQVTLRIKRG